MTEHKSGFIIKVYCGRYTSKHTIFIYWSQSQDLELLDWGRAVRYVLGRKHQACAALAGHKSTGTVHYIPLLKDRKRVALTLSIKVPHSTMYLHPASAARLWIHTTEVQRQDLCHNKGFAPQGGKCKVFGSGQCGHALRFF